MSDSLIIKGTAHWAHVHKVNPMSKKFQIDVTIDAETAKTLKSHGVKIKKANTEEKPDDTRGVYVTAKSSLPVAVVDARKQPTTALIGNGSTVKVKIKPFEFDFKGKKGISLGLQAVQVLDLVAFQGDVLKGFEDESMDAEGEETSVDEDIEL